MVAVPHEVTLVVTVVVEGEASASAMGKEMAVVEESAA